MLAPQRLSTFLSAFLQFYVQPLIAKFIPPWFGGWVERRAFAFPSSCYSPGWTAQLLIAAWGPVPARHQFPRAASGQSHTAHYSWPVRTPVAAELLLALPGCLHPKAPLSCRRRPCCCRPAHSSLLNCNACRAAWMHKE